MLQLRDGSQIAVLLSLYRSPETLLDYSDSKGGNVPGIDFFLGDGQITSWAD